MNIEFQKAIEKKRGEYTTKRLKKKINLNPIFSFSLAFLKECVKI